MAIRFSDVMLLAQKLQVFRVIIAGILIDVVNLKLDFVSPGLRIECRRDCVKRVISCRRDCAARAGKRFISCRRAADRICWTN